MTSLSSTANSSPAFLPAVRATIHGGFLQRVAVVNSDMEFDIDHVYGSWWFADGFYVGSWWSLRDSKITTTTKSSYYFRSLPNWHTARRQKCAQDQLRNMGCWDLGWVVWFGFNFQIWFGKWICKYGEEGEKGEEGKEEAGYYQEKERKKTNTKCHCRKLPLTHGGDGGWGKKEEDEGWVRREMMGKTGKRRKKKMRLIKENKTN